MRLARRPDIVCAIIVSALAASYFSPILHSGLIDSDGYLQHLSAVAAMTGERALDVYREAAHTYDIEQAGWYPLGSAPIAIWLADPPPFFAKLAQLGLVTITFATFALLARRLFHTTSASALASIVVLAIWQLRIPHDPIVGTSFVTPWAAEAILFCYTCWLWFAASRRLPFLFLACVGMVASILCTPIGFGVGLSFIFPIVASRSLRAGATAILAVAIGTAYISIAHGTRLDEFGALGAYGTNAVAQLIAPLPATFRAFGHIPVAHVPSLWHGTRYVDDRFIRIPEIDLSGWLRAIAITAIGYLAVQRGIAAKSSGIHDYQPLLIGLTLWIVPALLVGSKVGGAEGLSLGQSLDSVYLQCFGIAILSTWFLLTLARARPQLVAIIPPVTAATIFLLAYGNVRSDRYVIAQTVQAEYPRDVIQRASVAGFFKLLEPNSTIVAPRWGTLVTGPYSSSEVAKYMLYHYSKIRFNVIEAPTANEPPTQTWILGTSHRSDSLVSLSHWSANSGNVKLTDESFHYSLIGVGASEGSDRGLELTSTTLVDGFALLARRTCGAVPIDSALEPSTPRIEWGRGFYRPGPVGYSSKNAYGKPMLMGPTAQLQVVAPSCGPESIQFNAVVQAPNPGTLAFGLPGHLQRLVLSNTPQTISLGLPKTASRTVIDFKTDATGADLNPVYFRYDQDRPLDTRLILSGASLTALETPIPALQAGAHH